MTRWIATAETLFDHPVVGMTVPPPLAAAKERHAIAPMIAWQDIIRSAAWKPHKVNHKGKVITLDRGQFLAGRSFWAARWNWGEQSVRSFFAKLVENKMIEICNQSSGHLANVASVCNFEKYQAAQPESQPDQKPVPNQCPTSAQPEGNQTVPRTTLLTDNAQARENAKMDDVANANTTALRAIEGDLKSAFNGQTEVMLADVQRWMGPSARREHAVQWLSGTLSAYGSVPTIEAHKFLLTDVASGKPVPRPLVVWSKSAGTMKAKGVGSMRATNSNRPKTAADRIVRDANGNAVGFNNWS